MLGVVPFAASLVLATDLVVHRVFGPSLAWKVAAALGVFVAVVWGALAWSYGSRPRQSPAPRP